VVITLPTVATATRAISEKSPVSGSLGCFFFGFFGVSDGGVAGGVFGGVFGGVVGGVFGGISVLVTVKPSVWLPETALVYPAGTFSSTTV